MKIEVNIDKKHFFIISALLILGFLVMYVNAYVGNVGHTSDQIDEVDPTVLASVKDGVAWGELSNIPAGFNDGIDDNDFPFCPSFPFPTTYYIGKNGIQTSCTCVTNYLGFCDGQPYPALRINCGSTGWGVVTRNLEGISYILECYPQE